MYSSQPQYKPSSSIDVNEERVLRSNGMKTSKLSLIINTKDDLTSPNDETKTQDGARFFSKTNCASLKTQPEPSIGTSRCGNRSVELMAETKQMLSGHHEYLDKATQPQPRFAPGAAEDSNIGKFNSERLEEVNLKSCTHYNTSPESQLIHGSSFHDRLADQDKAVTSTSDQTLTEAEKKLLVKFINQLHPGVDVLKAFPSRAHLAQFCVIREGKRRAKKEAQQRRYERFYKEGEDERMRARTHSKNLKTEPSEEADTPPQTVKPSAKTTTPPVQYRFENIQNQHHMVPAENTNHASTCSTKFSKKNSQHTKHKQQIATEAKGHQEYDRGRAAFTRCLVEIQKKDRYYPSPQNVRVNDSGAHRNASTIGYVSKTIRSRSPDIIVIDTDSESLSAKASPSVQSKSSPRFPPDSFTACHVLGRTKVIQYLRLPRAPRYQIRHRTIQLERSLLL